MSHQLVLVLGLKVGEQLALWGDRARTVPYRRYLDARDLAMTRTSQGLAPDHPLDDDELRALIRRDWAHELGGDGLVDHDSDGWFIVATESRYARWDGWAIGWREPPLIALPGRPVIGEQSWDCVSWSGDYTNAEWIHPTGSVAVRGMQARLGDLDVNAMYAEASAELSDTGWDAIVYKGAWHEPATLGIDGRDYSPWWTYAADLLRRLPAETLVTAVDCHS